MAIGIGVTSLLMATSPASAKSTTKRKVKRPVATTSAPPSAASTATFKAEVWADNWFSMAVNGTNVGKDSVPITTERSFNAETFTFTASYPLTIAIEANDFKQTDSGIEYIGKPTQQMGDGGLIAQITDVSTGRVIAVTNANWKTLVIQQAPLNPSCEKDADPDKTCKFSSMAAPADWTNDRFDDSAWTPATVWSAAAVGPKGGHDEVSWNSSAKLVWGTDLYIDNTILLRLQVKAAISS